MIPVLYNKDEKNFYSNGLGQMVDVLEATVEEVANGEFELEVIYPISGRLYNYIEDHVLIKARPNSADDPHVFRVYEHEIDTVEQIVIIHAHSITNDLGYNMVTKVNVNSLTPQEAMNLMKSSLVEHTEFDFVSDITTRSSTEWINRNPLNCIAGEEGSLIHYWGGEIKRDNRTIYLYRRRGNDNVAVIRDGKSIAGLNVNYSTKGMVTKVIPYRTYKPENSEEEITEYGTPVESQYIGNYPVKYVRAVDYSQDDSVASLSSMNAKAKNYFTINNGIDKPSISVDVDLVELSDSSEYEKFKDFENVKLFDTVTVYSKRYDIQIEAKITKIVYDSLGEKNISLEMGSYRTGLIESIEREYKEIVSQRDADIVQIIQRAANGKNKIFRGVDEPTAGMMMNDLWYKPIGDGETEMYQFDGMYWQLILSTADTTKIQLEVDAAIAQAEEAKQTAEQNYADSVAEAERLVQVQTDAFNAQMSGVNQEISTVKSNIDTAIANVDTAIANVNQEIANNFTSLSDSISDVDDIATQAKNDAQTAISNAQTAKTDAQTALSNASTALGQAQSAVSTAASANNKAVKSSVVDWALSSSGTTPPTSGWRATIPTPSSTQYTWGRTTITLNDGTTIPSYNVSKIGVKGDPGAKGDTGPQGPQGVKGDPGSRGPQGPAGSSGADAPKITSVKQQFYLSTSNTTQSGGSWSESIPVWSTGKYYWTRVVTTYDNSTSTPSVPVLDNALNQSLVSALEAKSDTQTLSTTVSQHATQIAAKANQTTVDTLAGRVSTAEGSIKVQAGQIALKANQTTVDTLTGRVGTAETNISANTSAINLRATKTELTNAIDAIEVGGRNYFVVGDALENTLLTWATGTPASETGSLTSGFIPVTKGDKFIISPVGTGQLFYYDSEQVNIPLGNMSGGTKITVPENDTISYMRIVFRSNFLNGRTKEEVHVKIEKGTKATDWTPAPEDVDASIATVQSNLTVEAGKITALTTRVSGSETNISNVTQTVSGINTTISTLRTDVNGKATIVSLNQVKSTADGNKTTISNHAGRLTTVETNVNGLQTTVSNKAEQSQVTQMANSLTSVVTSLNGVSSGGKNLLTNGSFENWTSEYGFIGWGQYSGTSSSSVSHSGSNALYIGASSGYKAQQDIPVIPGNTYEIKAWVQTSSNANGTANNQKLRIGNYDGGAFLTDIGWNGAKTEWTELSKEWTVPAGVTMIRVNIMSNHTVGWVRWDDVSIIDITNEKATQSQITQLSTDINLRVTKGDVVSQINIEAGRTLISSNKLLLDANTYIMGTTFANDVKAKSLEAITANITSIRSQVLVTDSVTSTHIKAENALIDTIFGTTALITRLTSKTAFINNIKAIEISADKVTTGTLNAANVNIINLNASNITAGRLNGLELYGGYINGGRITSTGTVGELAINSASLTVHNDKVVSGKIQRAVVALSNTQQDFPGLRIWHGVVDSAGVVISTLGSTNITPEDGIATSKPLKVGGVTITGGSNIQNSVSNIMHITDAQDNAIDLGVKNLIASGNVSGAKVTAGHLTLDGGNNIVSNSNNNINFKGANGAFMNIAANTLQCGNQRMGSGGTFYSLDGRKLWFGDANDNPVDIGVRTIQQTSHIRYKENFSGVSEYEGLKMILDTDVVRYNFKGDNEPHLGLIIDDVHKYYKASDMFVSGDRTSKKDSDIVGALMLSVKHLHNSQQIFEGNYSSELWQLKGRVSSDILRIDTFVTQYELEIKNLKKRIKQLEEKIV